MSGIVHDLPVIDDSDFKKLKKLKGQKLIDIKKDKYDDLVFVFENKKLTISAQESYNYGFGVFYEVKNKQKFA